MCLISFSWQPEAKYPLVMVANRDEFYARPTAQVHYWEDNPDVLGGRDLQANGSWLAINKKGRFAAVTNYREVPIIQGELSRGNLVRDFLENGQSPEEYLSIIHNQADMYSGFNLLIGDKNGIYYYSNRMNEVVKLKPGVHALCNHLLDTPWPKLTAAKQGLSSALDCDNHCQPESLIQIMNNASQASEDSLPSTGISIEREKLLSSRFIASNDYGTRNTSVLILNDQGELNWLEQNYSEQGVKGEQLEFILNFPMMTQ
ncbi:hypothetical protein EOPP23_08980 [Endozoicomonas sp. OPT23]|uniref:NRDE family protein n=1 Tax=Endozoicomonas sp. OPT23 TaxID=2072845 RepID=UPI00129B4280|nr:NRDE family protein [Endozoicomonas sp. OPT23]MRI33115.1 hypothetical protein [Endozoicomonas sp. OPT23]